MSWRAGLVKVVSAVLVVALASSAGLLASPLASATGGIITQVAPTSGSTTVVSSSTFSDQLNVTGNVGAVTYTATGGADISDFTVTTSGDITVNSQLAAGPYVVTGIDNDDPNGDNGTWTYTLDVGAITQVAPTSGSTTVVNSSTFSDQLNVTGNVGAVTYTATGGADISDFTVTPSGAITVNSQLAAGPYVVTGIDNDDPNGDSGTWTYTLDVVGPISQVAPTTGSTTVVDSNTTFSDQLHVTGNVGPVTYTATGGANMSDFTVTTNGAITANSQLGADSYVVTGIDSDPNGDSGTWTYTLDVVGPITQVAPTTGSTTVVDSSTTFSAQLHVTGNDGAVTYTATGGANMSDFTVTTNGVITANSQLGADSYVVTGIDSDPNGDSGAWTYTLTVTGAPAPNKTTIVQTSPTTGSVSTVSVEAFTSGPITVDGNLGPVTFVTTNPSSSLVVTPSGLISTTGSLPVGSYRVSGTDSDSNGDSGTWTYTLTVTAPPVTVTFDDNGGTGSMSPEEANSPTTLSLNQIVRKGYTFVDWNTSANGTGVSYANGAVFPFTTAATLFAQWKFGKTPTRTITFVANGGNGSMTAEIENTPTAIKANDFTRPGYNFVDWNMEAGGTGRRFEPGDTYAFKRSITLYAQWKKIAKPPPKAHSYVVTFVANGGTGIMAEEEENHPLLAALTPSHFARSGYTFLHWNTKANGSGNTYANGATYSFSASITLYAQWKKDKAVVPPPPVPSGTQIGPFTAKSSTLSSALEAQIGTLAVEAMTKKSTVISLLGYGDALSAADASNPTFEAANIALSRERAQTVATYLGERLTALGLSGWSISIAAAPNGRSGSGQGANSIVIATLS